MKTKMRYLTTLVAATTATVLAIGFAPVAIADPGTGGGQNGPTTPPDPGTWDGGQAGGGTGTDTGPNVGTGPSYWHGGEPGGGTGTDTGPNTGTGPNIWSGGESAGAIG